MSQDMMLHQGRGLPAAPEDLWGGNNGHALGPHQPQNAQQGQGLKKIHRLLRGRYIMTICCAAACGIAGGILGFKSQVPLYVGQTAVEIKPVMPTITLLDKAQGYFNVTVKDEAYAITNSETIAEALQNPIWITAGGHKYTPDYVAVFQSNATATLMKDGAVIVVQFQSENPKLAAAGANAIVAAYKELKNANGDKSLDSKLGVARDNLEKETTIKRNCEEQVANLTKDYGGADVGKILDEKQERYETLKDNIAFDQMQLDMAQAALPDTKGNRTVTPLDPQQLATIDPQMRTLLNLMEQKTEEANKAATVFGPNNPAVARAKTDQQLAVDAVNQYATQMRQQYKSMVPGSSSNTPFVVSAGNVQLAKSQLEIQNKQLALQEQEITNLGVIHQKVVQVMEDEHRADDKINELTGDVDRLTIAQALNGQIETEGDATTPLTPTTDKRKQFALAGFVVGGGLPVGLILLMGLLDARYRYSEEASDSGVSGLTLLGILPNLPDRLSDPGQASIAAHCVHQIRTMLQINNNEDRRAFAVTSASSGDGKTSLTLALGLSFAASGSRTLLIDSDLVGAGLTARLGMNGPEGILEAMTNGNLLEYTKTTDVSDLAILPVGLAQLHHAGIFSPQAVRRLVNEAKKHFEVILIDTGPILGSIEATPVTAASDGVILTVARGQQRPLVDKALTHLRSIGARVAGVVFNRAQAKDFEQSISGISMRSASRSANGNNNNSRANQTKDAGQYGPVARAVATSFRGAENGNGNGNGES